MFLWRLSVGYPLPVGEVVFHFTSMLDVLYYFQFFYYHGFGIEGPIRVPSVDASSYCVYSGFENSSHSLTGMW